ncbi:MAG: DUF4328 domain-containing protein [Pirellulales bacterium]
MGANWLEYTPGWSVGWFFVPLANLIKGFQVVAEVEKAARNVVRWKALGGSPLIWLWWLGYLGNNVFARLLDAGATSAMQNANIQSMQDACRGSIISSCVSLATYVPLTMLIVKITSGLEAQHQTGPSVDAPANSVGAAMNPYV